MKVFSMCIRLSILARLNSLICQGGKSGHLFRGEAVLLHSRLHSIIGGLNPISSAIVSGGSASFLSFSAEQREGRCAEADDDRVLRLQAHDSA